MGVIGSRLKCKRVDGCVRESMGVLRNRRLWWEVDGYVGK